jgi:hypothetical protein
MAGFALVLATRRIFSGFDNCPDFLWFWQLSGFSLVLATVRISSGLANGRICSGFDNGRIFSGFDNWPSFLWVLATCLPGVESVQHVSSCLH